MPQPARDRVEDSLERAIDLLSRHFGSADQQAAVQLAALLYSTREHDEFLREHPEEPGAAYP